MDKNLAPDGYYVPRILFVGKYTLKVTPINYHI